MAGHCFILIYPDLARAIVRLGSSDCLYDLYQLPLCLEVDVVGCWYRAGVVGPDFLSEQGHLLNWSGELWLGAQHAWRLEVEGNHG